MGRQQNLPANLAPLGATCEVAAAFCSFSPGKFLDLVQRGLMPKPKCIDGMKRWDLEEVRMCFKSFPSEAEAADETWADVDAS